MTCALCSVVPAAHLSSLAWRSKTTLSAVSKRPVARCSPLPRSGQQTTVCQRQVGCRAVARDAKASASEAIPEPTVEEVMTPHPIVLQSDMPIKEAVRIMLDKDISGAPVVDAKGKLVGILSESDVIWKGAGAPQDHFIIPPVFIGFADAFVFLRDNKLFEEEVHKILAKTVGEAMTADPASVAPSTPMSDAAALMLAKKVNRLPVVENGKVVGVLTRHDVLRGMYAAHNPLL